jgi:hypothetical protein
LSTLPISTLRVNAGCNYNLNQVCKRNN